MKHLSIGTGITGLVAAGILVALALAPVAGAWSWQSLPSGYGVSSYTTVCHTSTDPCVGGDGSTCNHVTITASTGQQLAETDCVNPSFGSDVDAFVNSTICQVNPAAGGSACAPATTASPPATTDTATTTSAAPVTTTAPAPVAPPATTTTAAAAPPYADFTAVGSASGVSFVDASTAGSSAIASRGWQFGDGAAATGGSPTHSYAPGDYYVTLIVVDQAGLTGLAIHEVTVTQSSIALGPRLLSIVKTPATTSPSAVPHTSAKLFHPGKAGLSGIAAAITKAVRKTKVGRGQTLDATTKCATSSPATNASGLGYRHIVCHVVGSKALAVHGSVLFSIQGAAAVYTGKVCALGVCSPLRGRL